MNMKGQQLLQQLCPCHLQIMSCQNTEMAKNRTCKPVIYSLVEPHCNHLPLPLQVFFDVKHLKLNYIQLL